MHSLHTVLQTVRKLLLNQEEALSTNHYEVRT